MATESAKPTAQTANAHINMTAQIRASASLTRAADEEENK